MFPSTFKRPYKQRMLLFEIFKILLMKTWIIFIIVFCIGIIQHFPIQHNHDNYPLSLFQLLQQLQPYQLQQVSAFSPQQQQQQLQLQQLPHTKKTKNPISKFIVTTTIRKLENVNQHYDDMDSNNKKRRRKIGYNYNDHDSFSSSTLFSSISDNNNILDDDDDLSSIKKNTNNNRMIPKRHNNKRKRISILVCPAQFCVPADYTILFDTIRSVQEQQQNTTINNKNHNKNKEEEQDEEDFEMGTCVVCDLPRTEWLRVAKQLPTRAFLNGNLDVKLTLDWYFDSIEKGIQTIYQQEGTTKDTNICIIGHSIGGWIARAYLGGMACTSTSIHRAVLQSCSSFITLGTPHIVSPSALVDQTRGLINAIEKTHSCSVSELMNTHHIQVTCVSSNGIEAISTSTKNLNQNNLQQQLRDILDLEKIIATSSYLPLLGVERYLQQTITTTTSSGSSMMDQKNESNETSLTVYSPLQQQVQQQQSTAITSTPVVGDGIVPIDLAFLPYPATRVVLNTCSSTKLPIRHAHVLPTPWNLIKPYEPSITLPNEQYPSYVSSIGVVQQWYRYIQ